MRPPNVAILISGHLRHIDSGIELVKQLSKYLGADVFVHTWDDQYDEINRINNSNLPIVCFESETIMAPPSRFNDLCDLDLNLTDIPRSFYMIYGIVAVYQLLLDYEKKTNKIYDLAVRLRTDVRIDDVQFFCANLVKTNLNNAVLFAPSHDWLSAIGAYSDTLIYGNIKSYNLFIQCLKKSYAHAYFLSEENGYAIPEYCISKILYKNDINLSPIVSDVYLLRDSNTPPQFYRSSGFPLLKLSVSYFKFVKFLVKNNKERALKFYSTDIEMHVAKPIRWFVHVLIFLLYPLLIFVRRITGP